MRVPREAIHLGSKRIAFAAKRFNVFFFPCDDAGETVARKVARGGEEVEIGAEEGGEEQKRYDEPPTSRGGNEGDDVIEGKGTFLRASGGRRSS